MSERTVVTVLINAADPHSPETASSGQDRSSADGRPTPEEARVALDTVNAAEARTRQPRHRWPIILISVALGSVFALVVVGRFLWAVVGLVLLVPVVLVIDARFLRSRGTRRRMEAEFQDRRWWIVNSYVLWCLLGPIIQGLHLTGGALTAVAVVTGILVAAHLTVCLEAFYSLTGVDGSDSR